MVGILTHREVLALAHHVPDVAEHEEIACHRTRQAGKIVGVAGDEPGGKAFCKSGCRILVRHGIADPLRQFIAERDVLLPRQFDEAVGEIGVVGCQCRFDIFRDDGRFVPQGKIELGTGQCGRIVLCGQQGIGVARMRPQRGAHGHARCHANHCNPQPHRLHPEKPFIFTTSEMVCRFLDTTAPTKEGLLRDDKIVSNLHEQMNGRGL